MLVTRPGSVDEFLARAGEFLVAREAEHNLILGLSSRLRHDPRFYGEEPYFAVVEHGAEVVAAALRTPPHNLVLSEVDDARAVEALATHARGAFRELPGLLAPSDVGAAFADAWKRLTGVPARIARAERIYRADSVTSPAGVGGEMRPYAADDRELAVAWIDAFVHETGGPRGQGERVLEQRSRDPEGGMVLWDDAGPVSLAGFGGPTPNGIRIGPVYTPPDRRRRGYASALTAALTRSLLEAGRRFCFLFTDLANPTSNSIYQQVGYRPVADVDEWVFEAGATAT